MAIIYHDCDNSSWWRASWLVDKDLIVQIWVTEKKLLCFKNLMWHFLWISLLEGADFFSFVYF